MERKFEFYCILDGKLMRFSRLPRSLGRGERSLLDRETLNDWEYTRSEIGIGFLN